MDSMQLPANERLGASKAFLQAILDSAEYSVIASDRAGMIVAFNRGAEKMLGYRADEVVGKVTPEIIHDQEEVAARAAELSAELGRAIVPGFEVFVAKVRFEGHEEREWTYVRKDGSRFPVLLSVTVIRDDRGENIGYMGIGKDITIRKAAEDALQQSEQRFRQLAENIDDIFWITNGDGREVIYVSPAYEKIWQRTCSSLYAKPSDWLTGIHAEDRERVAEAFFQKAAKGEYDEEFRVVREDGSIRWVRAHGSPLRNSAGEVCRIVGVARDVTERRRYEEQLHQARRQAEEANQAKSQFLAAMSHELRTPLHGVIGMVDLLNATRLNARQRRFLEACRNSANSLVDLISNILDLAKIESGKLSLESHPFELDRVVEDTARMIALRAQEKGLELICLIDEAVCRTVHGDSTRLRQVLVNLLSNAVKFTEVGEVCVRAGLESSNERIAIARFSVSDTGVGVPASQVGRLFNPFIQADASTTRRYGGSGLGLAISKDLVEAMGGQIGVDTRSGVGSTFWFTAKFESAADGERCRIVPSQLRSLRVLAVSKNDSALDALRQQLSAFGIGAETIKAGKKALRLLRQGIFTGRPFDLLIVDDALTDMAGVQLARSVRRNRILRSTGIFLLALLDDRSASPRCCDQRLSKPVCRSELLDALIERFCPAVDQANRTQATASSVDSDLRSIHAGKKRILLAEDNRVNQMFALEILHQAGLECDCAQTGAQAVEAVQTSHYDLILMDCHMPEMDGFEACRRIRQLERNLCIPGRLPMIALTANAVKGDREQCLAVGMDDYLTKPFEASDLIKRIDQLLASKDALQPSDDADMNPSSEVVDGPDPVSPIDSSALIARCRGKIAFAASLLEEVEATGTDRAEEISRLIAKRDFAAITEAAHALKGTAGTIEARPLESVAAQIETAGKVGDLERLTIMVDELRHEMRRCIDFVPQFRASTELRAT